MARQVCSGATIMCSFGSAPSQLAVSPGRPVASERKPAANVMDHVANENVMPFAKCNANPQAPVPCAPVTPTPWTAGSSTLKIAKQAALSDASQLICAAGGIITVIDSGQGTVNVP